MSAILVTLQQVKDHLHLTTPDGDPDDADLQLKLDGAEAAILDYCGSTQWWRDVIATWTATTVPAYVKNAILIQTGIFWRFLGDDAANASAPTTPGDLDPTVTNLLRRTRDPVIA